LRHYNGDGHEYAVYDSAAGHAQLIVDARLQLAGFP
jgi:hypothetical protein